MQKIIPLLFIFGILLSCSVKPKGAFLETKIPKAPNYSKSENWAALPQRLDMADKVPDSTFQNHQEEATVDVFFLHPTTYTGSKGQDQWNASLEDKELNYKTDQTTILYQASIFNGAGKVYAPRYRQAHLHVFYAKKNKRAAEKAYQLAYQDLKSAFEYYLKHYNEGRPIIIASHSQGTGHGKTLIKEFFDGTALQAQLVAAYLVGWPVENDFFENIKVCETPTETQCFCSWRTFKSGYKPKKFWTPKNNVAVTNPLSWKTDEVLVPKENNEGALFYNFNKIYPQSVEAQVFDGLLWSNKPKFPGSFLLTKKNYHIADYNFYYANVRKNAQLRTEAFLKVKNGSSREARK